MQTHPDSIALRQAWDQQLAAMHAGRMIVAKGQMGPSAEVFAKAQADWEAHIPASR